MKRKCFSFFYLIFCLTIVVSQEQKLQYSGTVYNTTINERRVNVRDSPSLNAKVLFQLAENTKIQVSGVSKEYNSIDDYYGNWLRIKVSENQQGSGVRGWVFSKYVETGAINPSKIEIIEMPPKEEQRAQSLAGSYNLNGVEKQITLYPHKEENQDFYTFAFNIDDNAFHYTNIPGSYAWYPATNELKHISYIGTNAESAWVIFTNDFKYIIEDVGTGPGVRGLYAWQVSDQELIFSGSRYRNINLNNYTIEIVYVYDWYSIEHNQLDDEIKKYAEDYKKTNPEPEDMVQYSRKTGLGLELIIICEFDLDTRIRKIIRGQYIHTQ
jgi:hypothetical protein